ncbi:5-methyltetrahydropteroyltriglutamate/homocysteine S-methyltransferase [Corynebacterium diphtheriae]|nr:5-methyltetrahydropteroyltriglutamate/homocysteine S-methyltransferase [Corynebacterium diphtheriae]
MVQYFSEQLAGYASTHDGWVQSYGSLVASAHRSSSVTCGDQPLGTTAEQQPAYLQWAVGAFRLATSGVAPEVQIHTHMCYSEFNELIDTVAALDADVTSIKAARNGMQVLAALKEEGYELGVGPGVWDIHSPRVPAQQEIDEFLASALTSVDPHLLWVNPDCGLKTRGRPETLASLQVLVAAAIKARTQLV